MKKLYEVVAGILIKDNLVLCGERGPGYFESKWEFPGGNIEPKETKLEALKREIQEELGCVIKKVVFFSTVKAEYEDFVIHLDTYLVSCGDENPKAIVHTKIKWEHIENLIKYMWCDADKLVVDEMISKGTDNILSMLENGANIM